MRRGWPFRGRYLHVGLVVVMGPGSRSIPRFLANLSTTICPRFRLDSLSQRGLVFHMLCALVAGSTIEIASHVGPGRYGNGSVRRSRVRLDGRYGFAFSRCLGFGRVEG